MKNLILMSVILVGLSFSARAQVGVNVDNIDTTQETTISIKKGESGINNKKKWTVTEGEEEVTGDKDTLMKSAEKSWKKACEDWKKDFKESNKGNVISATCGKMVCEKDGVESVCTSMAKHKLKVLTEE